MHRCYAEKSSFKGESFTLSEDEARHLSSVLRAKTGDKVSVFDGEGNEFSAEIIDISKRSATLGNLSKINPRSPESHLDLTLACAMLKGEKFDLVVQKAVELGVRTLVPMFTERCEVKPERSSRVARWRKIALEASKQCGRAVLMSILEPEYFGDLIKTNSSKLMFAERGGGKLSMSENSVKLIVFIGPEGGWSDSEIHKAAENNAQIITFGGRVLRAETAAIALTAIVQNHFGDIN